MSNTIFALATPLATSPLAVIRISGKDCHQSLERVVPNLNNLEPRKLVRTRFKSLEQELIDEVMVVRFASPNSFTGEDMVEIFCHGNPLIVEKIMRLLRLIGFRDAQPGEFSKRAFLNSKIDLAQAEGLAAMIGAKSEEALKISQSSYFGKLSVELNKLKQALVEALAFTEAHLDFVEEDIGEFDFSFVLTRIDHCLSVATQLSSGYERSRLALNGVKVSIVGKPNAGKSSLMNLILGKERSIVTDIPGTTRDYIEDRIVIDGFEFILRDLAGFRETTDVIERKGIELASRILADSDLYLVVQDITEASIDLVEIISMLTPDKPKWLILNKIDLVESASTPSLGELSFEKIIQISALNESYRDIIISHLRDFISKTSPISETAVTNERQYSIITELIRLLVEYKQNYMNQNLDILAELLREALKCLDEFTGRTYADDILGQIFSTFCIGK